MSRWPCCGKRACCLAGEARPNDDPFDALVCAAARALGLPLITRDGDIGAWDLVRCVW